MKRKGRKCSRHQSRDYAADHGESQGTADICTKATEHPIQRRWVFPDMNSSPWRTLFPWRTPGAGDKSEEEGVWNRNWPQALFHHHPCAAHGGGEGGWGIGNEGMKLNLGKRLMRERCFNFCLCFSLSQPILTGNKLN